MKAKKSVENFEKSTRLIIHLIGQYSDISDGGGVGATMLANWLGVTRQAANYHLRRMFKDKILMRKNVQQNGAIPSYRYVLGETATELYERAEFKNDYFEFVYTSQSGASFDRLSAIILKGM